MVCPVANGGVCLHTALGAPLALFRILGLDGIPIVVPSWAFKVLAGKPDLYPSGYQLLPPKQIDCVHRAGGTSVDVYEGFLGLDIAGVAAARSVHDMLDRFARPPHIRYVIANGFNMPKTVVGANISGTDVTEVFGDGDGTVPVWSTNPTTGHQAAADAFSDVLTIVADHVGLAGNQRFLNQLDRWIGEVGV